MLVITNFVFFSFVLNRFGLWLSITMSTQVWYWSVARQLGEGGEVVNEWLIHLSGTAYWTGQCKEDGISLQSEIINSTNSVNDLTYWLLIGDNFNT